MTLEIRGIGLRFQKNTGTQSDEQRPKTVLPVQQFHTHSITTYKRSQIKILQNNPQKQKIGIRPKSTFIRFWKKTRTIDTTYYYGNWGTPYP
jgi:hypothetical protein